MTVADSVAAVVMSAAHRVVVVAVDMPAADSVAAVAAVVKPAADSVVVAAAVVMLAALDVVVAVAVPAAHPVAAVAAAMKAVVVVAAVDVRLSVKAKSVNAPNQKQRSIPAPLFCVYRNSSSSVVLKSVFSSRYFTITGA
jgi:hypothetical protein